MQKTIQHIETLHGTCVGERELPGIWEEKPPVMVPFFGGSEGEPVQKSGVSKCRMTSQRILGSEHALNVFPLPLQESGSLMSNVHLSVPTQGRFALAHLITYTPAAECKLVLCSWKSWQRRRSARV